MCTRLKPGGLKPPAQLPTDPPGSADISACSTGWPLGRVPRATRAGRAPCPCVHAWGLAWAANRICLQGQRGACVRSQTGRPSNGASPALHRVRKCIGLHPLPQGQVLQRGLEGQSKAAELKVREAGCYLDGAAGLGCLCCLNAATVLWPVLPAGARQWVMRRLFCSGRGLPLRGGAPALIARGVFRKHAFRM